MQLSSTPKGPPKGPDVKPNEMLCGDVELGMSRLCKGSEESTGLFTSTGVRRGAKLYLTTTSYSRVPRTYHFSHKGKFLVPEKGRCFAYYMNHSEEYAQFRMSFDMAFKCVVYTAEVDVPAGSELLVNYGAGWSDLSDKI